MNARIIYNLSPNGQRATSALTGTPTPREQRATLEIPVDVIALGDVAADGALTLYDETKPVLERRRPVPWCSRVSGLG